MKIVPYFCPILTKFGFSRQIFIKVPNINSHGNPYSAKLAGTCGETTGGRADGRTDGHDEAHMLFRNYANSAKSKGNAIPGQALRFPGG